MNLAFVCLFTISLVVSNETMRHREPYVKGVDFKTIVKRKDYVDKSLFIKAIFDAPEKILITVPPSWGKSTNLEMTKKFLELQVDEAGVTLTKSTRKRHLVNDTPNYKIFGANSLKILQHKRIMERHFGKYPVIHVDFKCDYSIRDSENSVICFRKVIHKAIAEHKYLTESGTLKLKEKRFIEKWSDFNGKYEEFYGQDVTKALHKLAILLCKQFGGRRIFVLIDNYDFPSSTAMFMVRDGKELNRVMKFNLNIISTLLNKDDRYRCKAVVLGTSYVAAAGIYKIENIQTYEFLGNHPFQEYFGLSKQEISKLAQDSILNLCESEIDLAYAYYGGYSSLRGDSDFNAYSILNFLQTSTFKTHAPHSELMRHLDIFCMINFVRRKIEQLVNGGVVEIESSDIYTINDLINLRDIITEHRSKERIQENLIFRLMLEMGCLAYVARVKSENSTMFTLKLPNIEMQTLIGQKLKKYYDHTYRFDKRLLIKCASFFDLTSPSTAAIQEQFKRALYWFYRSFEQLIRCTQSRFSKFSGNYVYRLLFSVIYHLKFNSKDSYAKMNKTDNQFHCLLVNNQIGFLIELKVNDTSERVLENMIEEYSNCEANVISINTKKKILLVLGIDENFRLSISCLPNGKDVKHAFNIP